jgi:hypothetical protein
MRTYTIKKIEHPVYEDLDELPAELVYLKDWRKSEVGDWVLADDGCIIQILRKNQMRTVYRRGKVVVTFGTCTGTFSEKGLMDTDRRDNIYSISGTKKGKNLTINETLFAQHIVRGVSPEDAYLKVYRTNNRRYAKFKSGVLIKSERIRKIMKEELKPVMQSLGICPELVLAGIRDIATDEEAKHSDKLKALFELGEILELKDTQRTTEISGALFQGFEPQQLEKVERPKLKEVNNA